MSAVSDLPPRGLPEPLPAGEHILWQGAPKAAALARRALGTRAVALYFAVASVFVAAFGLSGGKSAGALALSLVQTGVACLIVLALIRGFAALVERTTVYTITNRRIVMRIGVALPVTLNLPFASIEGAGLRTYGDGTGDLPLQLDGNGRVGFVHLWPHARPWRIARPEPMLRCVPDAAQVAAILARALGAGPLGRAAAARAEVAAPPDAIPATSSVAATAA